MEIDSTSRVPYSFREGRNKPFFIVGVQGFENKSIGARDPRHLRGARYKSYFLGGARGFKKNSGGTRDSW